MRAINRWAGILCLALVVGGCAEPVFPDFRSTANRSIDIYKQTLENRLLERYNNYPEWAGQISRVELVVPHPPQVSYDRSEVKVEFNQLVYDKWGKRVPDLEKEYYMVTFGNGQARVVSSDPSVQVGLDMALDFGENLPVQTGRVGQIRRTETPQPPASATGYAPSAGPAVAEACTPAAGPNPGDGIPTVMPVDPAAPGAEEDDTLAGAPLPAATPPQTPPAAPPARKRAGFLNALRAPDRIVDELPRNEIRNLPRPAGPELD